MSVRMGIIGAGVWAKTHCIAYQLAPNAELVAICDIIPEKAKSLAEKYGAKRVYTDYKEMLKDPEIDAVAVVTPDYAHKEPVLDAAAAGKHILVEKPMATSLADAIEMHEAAKKYGVILMPDFHNRWNPCFVTAKESIADGSLGAPKYIFIRHSNTKYVPFTMLNWSAKSSVLWFLGSHACDLARFIMESNVKRVYTVSRKGVLQKAGIDIPDFFISILEFENGGVATIENSWILPDVLQSVGEFRAQIVCENGIHNIEFNTSDSCVTYTEKQGRGRSRDLYAQNVVYGKLKGFCYDSILHFLDCVENGTELICNSIDGIENTRTLEAMSKSLEIGEPVEVVR
ncbi:MAG TPA: Gfo/Idh/MocA family oxidoreductase [Clostridiaceae bacterium]|nr:Gfo/Idh/MocA family oxidoreductase [Clostridiaceae bacterium]